MRSTTPLVILTGILILLTLGCGKGSGPVAPPLDVQIPLDNRDSEGHVLWGAWDFTIDRDTLDIVVEPMRAAGNHLNVASFVMPPSCMDCIKMDVLDVDPATNTLSVRILLKNPTSITGFDIRGIVFLNNDQWLTNADNWTALHDIPGNYDFNPFVAFAKEKTIRSFNGGDTHAATYRLVLPPGNMAVSFAVDASHPTNCPEPYEMRIVNGIGFLGTGSSYSETIEVAVNDWQNDIAVVQLDLSALGAGSPVNLTLQGSNFKATVSNTYGASPGTYMCWLMAASATGPWLYEPVEIEVKSLGVDRLPEVLSLMYNWTAGGQPNDPLNSGNFKYEGSDLNWIFDDLNHGNTRLPYFNDIHRAPITTVPYCMNLLQNLQTNTEPPSLYNLLTIGSQQLGESFTPTAFSYNPTASPVADAMQGLYSAIGATFPPGSWDTINNETTGLPIELQYMVAGVLEAVGQGYPNRQDAINGYSTDEKNILFDNGVDWVYGPGTIYYLVLDESAAFDYPNMYRAAGPVLQALDGMRQAGFNYVPQPSDSWEWDTPIGRVKIGTSGNDTHSGDNYLLLLDPGGNDTYDCQAGGNSSLNNPFSIAIDLHGDDIYSDQGNWNYAFGAGRLGVGVLWDVYGNDNYDNHRFTQGFGHWGVGILLDSAGNDDYNADGASQGSGYMGMGIMVDEWGNDEYTCFQYSQGFGFVKGWGFACDNDGNDIWTARDDIVKYPSAQTADHNVSMSQGQGFGVRYDGQDYPNDTMWQSGGQGLLFDKSGDDEYSCGVFGGASAYWFGTGILADYAGNDNMYGIWYVYGATAHYGTAFLINKGDGDDSYTATTGVGVGGGHDFSNTFFLEEGGNDTYTSSAHSLGAGNDCGTGVFVDYAGDDNYLTTHQMSIGNGNYLDFRNRGSWGAFLDLGGTDTYQSQKQSQGCNNNSTWTINDIGAGGDYVDGIVIWQ